MCIRDRRNIVQCLDDFDIPLYLSHTVVDIEGRERVTGVTIAEVGADRRPIPGTERHYDCDTLLLSCGLIQMCIRDSYTTAKIFVNFLLLLANPACLCYNQTNKEA